MRYLNADQINQVFEEKSTAEQLEIYKKAFGIKEVYPAFNRVDCVASAMGFQKCVSGSGFYENLNN